MAYEYLNYYGVGDPNDPNNPSFSAPSGTSVTYQGIGTGGIVVDPYSGQVPYGQGFRSLPGGEIGPEVPQLPPAGPGRSSLDYGGSGGVALNPVFNLTTGLQQLITGVTQRIYPSFTDVQHQFAAGGGLGNVGTELKSYYNPGNVDAYQYGTNVLPTSGSQSPINLTTGLYNLFAGRAGQPLMDYPSNNYSYGSNLGVYNPPKSSMLFWQGQEPQPVTIPGHLTQSVNAPNDPYYQQQTNPTLAQYINMTKNYQSVGYVPNQTFHSQGSSLPYANQTTSLQGTGISYDVFAATQQNKMIARNQGEVAGFAENSPYFANYFDVLGNKHTVVGSSYDSSTSLLAYPTIDPKLTGYDLFNAEMNYSVLNDRGIISGETIGGPRFNFRGGRSVMGGSVLTFRSGF